MLTFYPRSPLEDNPRNRRFSCFNLNINLILLTLPITGSKEHGRNIFREFRLNNGRHLILAWLRTGYFSNFYSTINQNSNRSNKLPADLSEVIIDSSSGTLLKFTYYFQTCGTLMCYRLNFYYLLKRIMYIFTVETFLVSVW